MAGVHLCHHVGTKCHRMSGKKPALLELSMEQITFCHLTVWAQKDPNLQPRKSFLHWSSHCAELRYELHRCVCFKIQKLLITLTEWTKVNGTHKALWRQQRCPSDSFLFCFYCTLEARNLYFPSKPPMGLHPQTTPYLQVTTKFSIIH